MNNNAQRSARYTNRYAGLKGILNRLFALVGLLVISPLFLITTICIMIESKESAIFKQERIGKDGK